MPGGTLLVSRDAKLFPDFKMYFESLGFPNVSVTDMDKDGLNMLINETNPDYFLIDSNFYDCGTPFMLGQLLGLFPKLNVAVITTSLFPDAIAAWFVFHGVKTYIKIKDGLNELRHALQWFLGGKSFIAPGVQKILDGLSEWPDVSLKNTRRQKEVLLMLCCGFTIKSIEDNLYVSKATVEKHIKELLRTFNCRGREELIKTANRLDIFSKEEMRFYDTGCDSVELPDWARVQQQITRLNERCVC